MADKLMTLLVGLLIALGGWSLSRTFELSTIQAVHEDKVHTLQAQVLKLEEQIDKIINIALNGRFTRLPMWKENPDNIARVVSLSNL